MIQQTGSQRDANTPTLSKLKRRLQQLETKRGSICARRAYLRNKKDQCVDVHEEKHRHAEESSVQFIQHHTIQLRREQRKEEEEKRKEWVDQERERTLSRLRSFREKKQGQYVLKTPSSRAALRGPPPTDPSEPLSIISLSPSSDSAGATPTATPKKKRQKPKDISVQIFVSPGTGAASSDQASAPPPPPPPPPPSPSSPATTTPP
ncbi:hypothetical protein SKAU_G00350240 [Synaphobranchus kaupii]|uniref:Uncharacterized protein n=1 Tax=Synaphobranchus kaupii TaxID=118154 RepID=A0A9Q1EK80_SYNKA|nr:hypothetical protein SKAU_G00350240 [Synaphobranchus kaupii]